MNNKSTIIIIVVLILAALGYFFMKGGSSVDDSALLQGDVSVMSDNSGAQVLALLNQINAIEIDPSIFSSPVYQTLRDFSVPIPPQNVGRPNPFEPVR
ncbi:MAG: hypothetical protein AB197_00800 [Parcubacteria bacterium C7867-002]|nr:MAG: hypothetical protein AB197_00800 [Parcubacteria bacterium C7867-002]